MKKSVLTCMLAVAALSAYAEDPTYNLFDPADCDADGWLWLDTPEKIAKYVGADKKIQLINSSLEIEDPDFPGEMMSPETVANAAAKGYNTKGEEGGEGSKTGAIILPEADSHGFFGSHGGGFLIQMPDCAQFDVYMSQKLPGVYTWIEGGRGYLSADALNYIWNEDDTSWDENVEVGPLKGIEYAGYDMNIQDIEYDLSWGEGTDILKIYGPKGEARTAAFYNFSLCPMLVQGIRVFTYTDVSNENPGEEEPGEVEPGIGDIPADAYNLFDPADCDANGWLWLDSAEKIAKYIGADKKIQLINSTIEVEDPDFPGEMMTPETVANPDVKGYNTKGEEGGAGSRTGAIVLPQADEHGLWGYHGGGFLIQMPDCAQFDVYMSQSLPGVYTWIEGGRGFLTADALNYIWNEDDTSWDEAVEVGPLKGIEYAGYDLNIQDIGYDLSWGEGTDILKIYGPKGEARTAAFYNFSLCPMLVQGIRVFTYTDVSMETSGVEDLAAEAVGLTVNGKIVTVAVPVEINVYNAAGVKVAGAYGTSLDCSALNGLYIVKAGNKAIKAMF